MAIKLSIFQISTVKAIALLEQIRGAYNHVKGSRVRVLSIGSSRIS